MYGKYLSGHASPVVRPIEGFLYSYLKGEGLHENIKFVITGCRQRKWKLFEENESPGEHKHTASFSNDHWTILHFYHM